MLKRPWLSFLLATVLGATFVWGLACLFVLRYEVGDIYPPYSTLRSDPLGTKVLATALGELPNIETQRNFKPLPKLHPKGPVTLVYAGVGHHDYWTDRELFTLDGLVAGGSRAVFTFLPIESPPSLDEDKRADALEHDRKKEKTESQKDNGKKKETKSGEKTPSEKQGKKSGTNEQHRSLLGFEEVARRWGFSFGYLPEEKGKAYYRNVALVEPGGHLESDITWHSALYFRDLKPPWKVLYMCGTMPVVIERKFGDGSIILVADSFLISNEALRGERHPRLISRIFSGPPTIVFDEDHHDLHESPGIASLARKYRLHGVVACLVLLAFLFVWKNTARFIPAHESSSAESDVVAGKESSEGFVNLLRRAIRPSAIFAVCLAEWRKTSTHQPHSLAKVTEIQAQLQTGPARERDPVAAYATISRALARKI